MPFDFGDVVLVPFPFTSQAALEKQAAGLLEPSVIKPVFATLEYALVIRRFRALHAFDTSALRLAIAQVIK